MRVVDRAAWDARAWAAAFADGRARPTQLVRNCLRQIERSDVRLGVCNHVADRGGLLDEAAASGNRWRDGRPLSPLDGVPFGVKANIAVAGFPWHGGIAIFRERQAASDAASVARLRAGGLIPMALFNMHEAALGETSDNPAFKTTLNPHDPTRIPGGSSGGSAAAVAAGIAPIALGTDSLGSVRLPSALCGVVGFKPGRDEIPTNGVMPLCARLDHVGVHARSVGDVAAVMRLLREPHRPVAESAPGAALAVGRVSSERRERGCSTAAVPELAQWAFAPAQPVCEPIRSAFRRLVADHGVSQTIDWTDIDLSALRRAGLLLCEHEAAEFFGAELSERPEGFSRQFRELTAWGEAQAPEKVRRAETLIAEASRRLGTELRRNLLLSPTTTYLAPLRCEPVPVTLADLTAPAAIAGVPAISVPMGRSLQPAPMGLQIAGLDSAAVLQAARRFFPGVAACAPLSA